MIGWCPNSFIVNIVQVNRQFIHCHVKHRSGEGFNCTSVYGFNDGHDREDLWSNLKQIASGVSSPWVLMGDFNALNNVEDRVGAAVRHGEIAPMLEFLNQCRLFDVKITRKRFTWNNKQEGDKRPCFLGLIGP